MKHPKLPPASSGPARREPSAAGARGSTRRDVLGGLAGLGAAAAVAPAGAPWIRRARASGPVLVGSANALEGMRDQWEAFRAGADPLDVVIEVVKEVEADPNDHSVGLGGLPNEDGVVQLDAACMHGPTHNSGAVAAIENVLHPSEVARLVMERTDHCLLVGEGAYRFAREHGHGHAELLTERAREIWLAWKESLSDRDDRLRPPPEEESGDDDPPRTGSRWTEDEEWRRALLAREVDPRASFPRPWGTVHCSALSAEGELACTTTTSGLAFKVPGRVGDSPIVGAGLYCDEEAGSAGSTGRGEATILANGSFAIVELMRGGMAPVDAGLEVLRRIARQVERQARWQPALLAEDGKPAFGVHFYAVDPTGRYAGVTMRGAGKRFAVAGPEAEPRHEDLVPLFE